MVVVLQLVVWESKRKIHPRIGDLIEGEYLVTLMEFRLKTPIA